MTLRAKLKVGGWWLVSLLVVACSPGGEGEPVARTDAGPLPPAGELGLPHDGGAAADGGIEPDDAGAPAPPGCEPEGATRSGSPCGINGRGTSVQRCTTGAWVDTGECSDPDDCVDDAERLSTTPCGLNDRGALQERCVLGRFNLTDDCEDPDECTDDDDRVGDNPCGSGGPFVFEQRCVTGQWQDTESCLDTTPAGWTCDAVYFSDDSCDCGCGVIDADCASTTNDAECARAACASPAYVDPADTTACVTVEDVCDLPASGFVSFDGVDDVAKHPLARQTAVGAESAPYALGAVSFDANALYVSWISRKFEAENVPLHLYVEVDPTGPVMSSLGKEYFGLIPELPFTPTHLIAARRSSVIADAPAYNGVYEGPALSATPYTTAALDLTGETFVAGDNHTLSVRVPWDALALSGCPKSLRLVAHVVKDATGTEWSDVLPLAHSPWLPGGGTYYELDLRQPELAWSEQAVSGTPGIACSTAEETRAGTTPCGRNLRGIRTQVCVDGIWQNAEECVETDVCVDDDTRIGASPCGAGGKYTQTCTQGAWFDTPTCVDGAPAEWGCAERYGDGVCDCGCGAQDYDCARTADYGECEANGCAAGAYPTATDTTTCIIVADVCDLPTSELVVFDGVDDVAKHPLARQTEVGAVSAPYALGAVSFDAEALYVSWVSRKFEAENVPLHLYVEVDPAGAATSSLGKEYFGLVPELPFTPTHLIAARRSSVIADSPAYNGVYEGPALSDTPYRTATFDLTGETFVAGDNHTLSVRVPWDALSSSGCPKSLRLVAHVVKDATGTEWSDVLPLAHSPWLPGGGTYYELDLRLPDVAWSEQAAAGEPGIACLTANDTRAGTTPCGRNLRGIRMQVCVDGIWQNAEGCVETDVCVDGNTRIGAISCGTGRTYTQTCTQGAWVDTSTCVDDIPAAWSCAERYGDGVCDCGCGAQDYDCVGTADYGECEDIGCAAGAYPTATDTTVCATPVDVCGLPVNGLVVFDGVDDVAKHDASRRVLPGASSASYAVSALSWDREQLYVSVVGQAFEEPYAPLHLYLEVDGTGPATAAIGKQYSQLAPKLPFTPTHLVAGRRISLGYNRIYTGADFNTAGPELPTYVASDNHTLSLGVPWSALSSSGCPATLRLAAHVVKAQSGSEWTETLPPTHTPWADGGGAFYEIDLLGESAATAWALRP